MVGGAGSGGNRTGSGGGQLLLGHRPAGRHRAGRLRAVGGGAGRRNRLDGLAEHQSALYESRQDYGAMVRTVEDMVDGAKARINALVLRSDNLSGVLGRWTPKPYKLETKKLGDKTVLALEKRGRPPEPRAARLRIAVAEIPDSPGHHCAVSDCTSAEFAGIFAAFVSKYSPDISRLFLTGGDMAGALGGVESLGHDVAITYGSTKGCRLGAGVLESNVRITSVPRAAFFRELGKGERAAITVRYIARVDSRLGASVAARGTIARDCCFSASVGAGILFRTVIPKALAVSLERNGLIEASAKSAEAGEVEPTVIRFARQIFKNKEINQRYVDMIAKMPDSSISAYHVNPHIHLSLVDYTDGSSYDIWVLDGYRLTIVPQIRASGASLKRLVNYLLERMGEGRVEKYGH